MDIEALDIFTETARASSFSVVARRHGVDPSSISRSIAALEQELGLRLFQRSTRRLALTEAGQVFLDRIEGVTDAVAAATDAARGVGQEPAGSLRLTASVAFGQAVLVPLLPLFRAAYPRLALDLLLSDANYDLVADRIDLAIRLGPAMRGEVIAAKLFDTQYRLCASPSYLAAAAALDCPRDLAAHRCLRFDLPEFRSPWRFRRGDGPVEDVPVEGDITISNALALRDCAISGMGPALLPDWLIAPELAAGRLVRCLPDWRVAAHSFDTAAWMIYPSRSFLPHKVRVTIDFLRRHLGGPRNDK